MGGICSRSRNSGAADAARDDAVLKHFGLDRDEAMNVFAHIMISADGTAGVDLDVDLDLDLDLLTVRAARTARGPAGTLLAI
jgi:hypothetical protein